MNTFERRLNQVFYPPSNSTTTTPRTIQLLATNHTSYQILAVGLLNGCQWTRRAFPDSWDARRKSSSIPNDYPPSRNGKSQGHSLLLASYNATKSMDWLSNAFKNIIILYDTISFIAIHSTIQMHFLNLIPSSRPSWPSDSSPSYYPILSKAYIPSSLYNQAILLMQYVLHIPITAATIRCPRTMHYS